MSNSSEEVQDLVPDFDLSADFLCRWAGETPICLVAIKEGVKTEAKIFGPGDIARLKDEGVIKGGMVPKLETCVAAVESGCEAAVVLDGRVAHAMLIEFFTARGAGTLVKA